MFGLSNLVNSIRNIKIAVDFLKDMGKDTDSVFDLQERLRDTPQMQVCLDRLKANPAMAQLIAERYMGPDIDLAALKQMPKGSLGYSYATVITNLGYDPEFYRDVEIKDDADYVVMRVRKTHDIHHIVTGFSLKPEGETGVLGMMAAQCGYPSFTVILLTALVIAYKKRPELFNEVLQRVVVGLQIGWSAELLLAQKWEEGWEKSLEQWRSELQINAVTSGPTSWMDTTPGLTL
ncbi:hypothetical protein DO97_11405 [Neosynechococcus sphagnicola sy1]|uniref:Ubiquinone biosynthesis protein n=1 Tax=Neosynechococcus sphagnicola sy1 TaxID=1497020 RepID=A0A098TN15_9CYAN|nr:Coq4 family protein [Neosynechococcus sphagnicola]KGF72233.1 hypothetical protein DO97_11405 [Neosynechococcus sphagnicola sy1]